MKSTKQTKGAKTKVKTAPDWAAPKFKGKTFAIAGRLRYGGIPGLVEAEGGMLVKKLTPQLDLLIVGERAAKAEKKAELLNQKSGACIQILNEDDFLQHVMPTRAEVLGMLAGGPGGIAHFNKFSGYGQIDLSGADFRNANLVGVYRFCFVRLNGADFREADLRRVHFSRVEGVRFENANLTKAELYEVADCCFDGANLRGSVIELCGLCSLVKANLTEARVLTRKATGCDFTGAILRRTKGERSLPGYCPATFAQAIFRDADMRASRLLELDFQMADLSGADLRKADLSGSDLTRADLRGANLQKAELASVRLQRADLRQADLRGANLADADLSGARLDGADFTGAAIAGAKVNGAQVGKAIGLHLAETKAGGKLGPNLKKLDAMLPRIKAMRTTATIQLPDGTILLEIAFRYGLLIFCRYYPEGSSQDFDSDTIHSFSEGIFKKTRPWWHGKLLLKSIRVAGKGLPVSGKEFKALVIAAWCEAFGVEPPSAQAIAALDAEVQQDAAKLRDELLVELRGGKKGVELWNARPFSELRRGNPFPQTDLAGAKLDGAQLVGLDFERSNFDGASLVKGKLRQANFKESTLRGADLREVDATSVRFHAAVFHGANLEDAHLHSGWLRKADFKDASLRNANLRSADLCGADFSGADLTGVDLKGARFNETTKFPSKFTLPPEMKWAGKGADPRKQSKLAPAKGPIDFDAFMLRLVANTYQDRLKNALKMLKADRFKLFADVDPSALVGVVKSQSDTDLVYSCKLTADGSYACCTQNLNVCGGLKGALCKHLLVLIVGLTKAGQLDPTTVDQWVTASMGRKPVLDKDAMSESFFRYKGAEAGEVDWRPTETIPEDYYAL